MKETAVFIARFQTPYLHEGHIHILNEIVFRHNKLVIILGVAPVKGSKRNPFDFYTRERMIKQAFPGVIVLPLKDSASDEVWSEQLDRLLNDTFPQERFILYGSRDSFIPFYHGSLSTRELPEAGPYSATTIREEHSDKVLDSEDFRMGINYAYNNMYAKVYPTVDIALFKEAGSKLLLGRKGKASGWRLPGGFVDPADSSFETAAKRELLEECGDLEVSDIQYVISRKIDDWRYRKEEGKIISSLFTASLVYGNPTAKDDLEKVEWFNVSELQKMMKEENIVAEHHDLIKSLLKHLEKIKTQKDDLINHKN